MGFVRSAVFDFAFAPQRIKTTGLFLLFKADITASVNVSQPYPLWLFGFASLTVKTVFKSKTPLFAQSVNSPCGISIPRSLFNSLKILTSDGGGATPFFTEKHNPCACPAP